MRISVLTMCPEIFAGFTESALVKRAVQKGSLQLEFVDIREFAGGSYRHIDDSPYGGGAGMIMRPVPVIDALRSVRSEESHTVIFAPCGNLYTQKKVHGYEQLEHLILICGHYEGIDARVYEECDELLSVGDYILSGGEIPAMSVIDSIVRMLGTIRQQSTEDESFENGLLEYPQYTKPAEFEGRKVPDVLLSGNHEKIRLWRLKQALARTAEERPDLLENRQLSEEEIRLLKEIDNEKDA
ncbi:MAG: tRNA (guanosine(37)-N1)-methyltransferase TrmD [Erysipelotrichaceae bacterium]|nr:tRNA (guanosine(37)-N1)-methyltransferase TrmD [Erysipelotrichaceae bacterium]